MRDTIGFRQQLSTTSFEAFELEIVVNYPVHTLHLNREWKFHAKSHELIGAFLACPPDWAQSHPLLRDERGLYRCLVAGQLYPSCGFSSADCRCFQLSNHCQEIHLASFVHHTALTDRDFKSESHFHVKFPWFCLISYRYLGLDSFPR